MDMIKFSRKRNTSGHRRAQAIVEFAIALPVLLMLLIGIMEVGRLILIYALVTNSSRDAVRYASAYGRGDDGLFKYKNCAKIKSVAQQSAFIVSLNSVAITYDTGPAQSSWGTCDASSGEDPDIKIPSSANTFDRVTVIVKADYKPMLTFLPISPKTITSKSSRTILGIYDLKDK